MLLLLACTPDRPVATGPSVLWVSLDAVRADRLEPYGGRAEAPNLVALATRGRRFDDAWSHWTQSPSSHWTMLTGVMPEVHGDVGHLHDSARGGPTAADLARGAGLTAAAFIGGWSIIDEATGLARGFDTWEQGGLDTKGTVRRGTSPGDVSKDFRIRRPAEEVTAEAAAWIRDQDAPWFAFVHLFDAHFPYTPDDPLRYDPGWTGVLADDIARWRGARDDGRELPQADRDHALALYDSTLTEMDAALAPLLEAAGPGAVVIVTADHGESFEDGYYFNHQGSLAPGVLHVPLIVAGPGVPAGVDTSLVGLVDVLPMVARLAAWPAAPMQGHDPITQGGRDAIYARTDPWVPGRVEGGRAQPLFAAHLADGRHAIWSADGQRTFEGGAVESGRVEGGTVEGGALTPAEEKALFDGYHQLIREGAAQRKQQVPPTPFPYQPVGADLQRQ